MPLITLCAAALIGVALGDVGRLGDPPRLLFAAFVAALSACLTWRHRGWRLLALATCALAVGGLRAATVASAPPNAFEANAGQVLRFGGTLVEPTILSSTGASVRLVLEVDAIGPGGHDLSPTPPTRLTVLADPALLDVPPRPADSTLLDAPAGQADPTLLEARPRPAASTLLDARPSPAYPAPFDARPGAADLTLLDARPAPTDPATFGQPGPSGGLAALAPVEVGDDLVLEGRLLGDAGAPPILFFPRLIAHHPPQAPRSPWTWLTNLRSKAAAGISRYLPEPQASLATGLLLGGSGHLDADFRVQLQRSGLAHLVAIDGFKQVIVAAALGAVCVRTLGPSLATLPIVLGIIGYTLFTGAHPSAVRAALMVGLASLAALTGRVADPLTSLLLAALAMAVVDPPVLLDVGLQLSLSATLGIVLLWPRLRRRLRGIPSFIAEPAGLTLAVTLATLPVTLQVFQSVSLISPLAHILALPLLPLALGSTAVLAAVSAVPALASVVAWLAWLPSTLLVEIIRVCGSLPGAAVTTGRLPIQAAVGLATGLLAWGLGGLPEAAGLRQRWARLWRVPEADGIPRRWVRLWRAQRRWSRHVAIACAALAAIALGLQVRPDGRLHVDPLNAGQGQAVLIRGPTGHTALVVGGRLGAALLASQVSDHLAVWEHQLNTVLELDAAAEAGLGLTLARYPADQRLTAAQDERIDLGGGAVLDVYAATDSRAAPRVALSYGRLTVPLFGHPPPTSAQVEPSPTLGAAGPSATLGGD